MSRTSYANLFAEIGTTFGVGDGSTTFDLPDLRGRFPLGQDNKGGTSADRVTASAADSMGGTDGDETKTVAEANLPSHTHGVGSIAAANESSHEHALPSGATGYVVAVASSSLYIDSSGSNAVSITTTGNHTGAGDAHTHSMSGTTGSSGSGTALDVMNPYLALGWIIKS